jgi:hypothetical protein
MQNSTKTILQELNNISLSHDIDFIVEGRGTNIIQSAINLLSLIRDNYDTETAALLERRFMNSIKLNDSNKFKRSVNRLRESRANIQNH